jgi:hypothetical protein
MKVERGEMIAIRLVGGVGLVILAAALVGGRISGRLPPPPPRP